MELKEIIVEIDYRYDAGKCLYCAGTGVRQYEKVPGTPRPKDDGPVRCMSCRGTGYCQPQSKQLIARVRERDAGGFVHGKTLLGMRVVKDIGSAMIICRTALSKYNAPIRFVISERIPYAGVRSISTRQRAS